MIRAVPRGYNVAMRMLASAMAAAAGLGTAAGVALVARPADPPARTAAVVVVPRPAGTELTRTVRVVSAPRPPAKGAKGRKGKQGAHGPKSGRGHRKPKAK